MATEQIPTDPATGLPSLINGAIVRMRSFTAQFNDGNLSLGYKRPKKKDTKGRYFVFMLLGIDDDYGNPDEVDLDEFLIDRGYADVLEVVKLVSDVTNTGMPQSHDEIAAEVMKRLREPYDHHKEDDDGSEAN